jgi:hypothetical protein
LNQPVPLNRAEAAIGRTLPSHIAALIRRSPGDYIVEIDGNRFPFPATESEVFEVEMQ